MGWERGTEGDGKIGMKKGKEEMRIFVKICQEAFYMHVLKVVVVEGYFPLDFVGHTFDFDVLFYFSVSRLLVHF